MAARLTSNGKPYQERLSVLARWRAMPEPVIKRGWQQVPPVDPRERRDAEAHVRFVRKAIEAECAALAMEMRRWEVLTPDEGRGRAVVAVGTAMFR